MMLRPCSARRSPKYATANRTPRYALEIRSRTQLLSMAVPASGQGATLDDQGEQDDQAGPDAEQV